jgi:hypothetical protein
MVLVAGDREGNLHHEKSLFFDSLQKYEYNKDGDLLFDCGITLNITQVLTDCEEIEMRNLRGLFPRKELQTKYCFWDDKERKLRTTKHPVGIGGEITKRKNITPICCLKLHLPGKPMQQQIFQMPRLPRLKPIFKDGETYPEVEYQGWEYC